MSSFDVAIGLNQDTMNKVATSLFNRPGLQSRIFTGSQKVNVLGVDITVGWHVQQPPVIDLNAPSDQQWKDAIKQDGTTPQPAANAFTAHFTSLKVTRTNVATGEVSEAVTNIQAICTIGINAANMLTITPLAAIVDLTGSKPQDLVIYKAFLIPKVLQMAATILSGEQIPNLDFQGIKFGAVALAVGSGRLVAVANLPGKPVPTLANIASFPGGPFSVMLSPDVVQQMANQGVQSLQGKSTGTSGSENYGVFKANYHGNVTLQNVAVSVNPADLTSVHASLNVNASAGAGVDVFGAIADTIADGAKKAADGIVDAANKVADAFSGY